MGQPDGGRHQFRDALALDLDARTALRIGGPLAHVLGLVVEDVAARVAHEAAGLEVLQRGGAVPDALVVAVKDVAFQIEADAAGRANARAGRDRLPVGRDAETPAPPRGVGVEGTGQAEHNPDVAVPVGIGAEGVLVVVALDSPWRRDGAKLIGAAVAIGVAHFGDIGPLREVEPAVAVGHAEGLMQSGGEPGPLDLADVSECAVADPDVTAAGAEGDLVLVDDGDRGAFHDLAWREGNLLALVKVGHGRGGRGEHGGE